MNGPLAVRARPKNAQAALREDALIRVDVNGGRPVHSNVHATCSVSVGCVHYRAVVPLGS